MSDKKFIATIYNYYRKNGRHTLPWRTPILKTKKGDIVDPYKILVSEIMLQQTQTERVIQKYAVFLKRFPTIKALAHASLSEVLIVWSGLGYNRRARYLKQSAEKIINDREGIIPREKSELRELPGIGDYTAGAIMAFAFNKPAVFLETNIRAVYIHFFFAGEKSVDDKKLIPIVERTLDKKNPRTWYSALMDYGAYLKSQTTNPTRKSTSYKRQSTFSGSLRQKRGKVLKYILKNESLRLKDIGKIGLETDALQQALDGLEKDGLIEKKRSIYRITNQ